MKDDNVEVKVFDFTLRYPVPQKRLDQYMASRFSDYSRTFIKKLMAEGYVTVNGKPVKPSHVPRPGDRVVVRVPMMLGEAVEPEDIALDVIYEDDWIIILNKPPDMVVHPSKGHQYGTLVNAVAYHCKQLSQRGGELRPGVVHRLDRDTSGVIAFVKDESVHERIAEQFADRSVEKEYLAICEGRVELDSDVVDAPIGRHVRGHDKMAIRHDTGKEASTVYQVVERLGAFTVVRCFPHSGRTHQIRVHLQHIGHPVVCDTAYGRRDAIYPSDLTGEEHQPSEEPLLARQALHARRLTIHHPVLDRSMTFEAEVAPDMMALIEALRRRYAT